MKLCVSLVGSSKWCGLGPKRMSHCITWGNRHQGRTSIISNVLQMEK